MTCERIWRVYPHCLPAALCAGLAASHLTRSASLVVATLAFALALWAFVLPREPALVAVAAAFAALGWWWGSARLESLDASVLVGHVGRTEKVTAVVTGPVRRNRFELRVPARLERLGRLAVDEPVLLKLPVGRLPPQGARLSLLAKLKLPRGPTEGFDERAWLRRQGIHTVLQGYGWRVIGRRGGIGGVSDKLRAWLEASIAPGVHGERRAVIAGIVLGADEGLSRELRDSFKASGLYHLLT